MRDKNLELKELFWRDVFVDMSSASPVGPVSPTSVSTSHRALSRTVAAPVRAEHQVPADRKRTLNITKLVLIAFASVAGGPYGFEESVGAAGVKYTLLGLVCVPWIWSIPLALMTAELSSAMPENGGHILWVDRAFGPFWSYLNGYWSLYFSIFEGGLYPVLFLDYIQQLLGGGTEMGMLMRLALGTLLIVTTCVINVYGLEMVASASLYFTCASLAPFLAIIAVGVPNVDFAVLTSEPTKPVDWRVFVTILLWSTAGYDLIGACAGEVKNPAKTLIYSMMYAMSASLAIDFCSLAVGFSVVSNQSKWEDGTFMDVAGILGGPMLQGMFFLGAAISTVGLLCTLLSTTSRITYGMAMVGTLPQVFAAVDPNTGNPWVAMLMNAGFMTTLMVLPFEALAEVEMWFYCLTTVLKFMALVRLRHQEPGLSRPYKIPLSNQHLQLATVPPLVCCFLVMGLCKSFTLMVGCAGVVFSVFMYYVNVGLGGAKRAGPLMNFDVMTDV